MEVRLALVPCCVTLKSHPHDTLSGTFLPRQPWDAGSRTLACTLKFLGCPSPFCKMVVIHMVIEYLGCGFNN